MPRYLAAYRTSDGAEKQAYVEGASVANVTEHLTRWGAKDVRIRYEDFLPAAGRNLTAEAKLDRRERGIRKTWRALQRWSIPLGLLIVIDVWLSLRRPPGASIWALWWTWGTLFVVVYVVLAVSPILLYERLVEACAWHDAKRMLRLLPWLERNPLAIRTPATRLLLAQNRAAALALLGQFDEAFALQERALTAGNIHGAIAEASRAGLLQCSKRYPEAIAARRRAAALDAKQTPHAAITMLRYGGSMEEARSLLEASRGESITELDRLSYERAWGLLALAEGRPDEALTHLDESRAIVVRELCPRPAGEAMKHMLDAHRALAWAALGERTRARDLLAPIEAFLRATDEEPLLLQIQSAIDAPSAPHRSASPP